MVLGVVITLAALGSLICLGYLKRSAVGHALFPIMYRLYANSRLGLWYHERNLAKHRSQYQVCPHSDTSAVRCGDFQVLPVPILSDNYAYIITSSHGTDVVVLDPGDADAVQERLRANHLGAPAAVVVTHKHWDHCGGVAKLQAYYPNSSIPVYGSAIDAPYGTTTFLNHCDKFEVGSSLRFTAYLTPGHTHGHMVYRLHSTGDSPDVLFSGDMLFLGGCGRIFEGSAAQMLDSLDLLSALPASTLMFPGHEYAITNLSFASSLNRADEPVEKKLSWAYERRQDKQPTCPSTIGEELQYNPFLRTGEVGMQSRLNLLDSSLSSSVETIQLGSSSDDSARSGASGSLSVETASVVSEKERRSLRERTLLALREMKESGTVAV